MKRVASVEEYRTAWLAEVERHYPSIDALEARLGVAVDKAWLNDVAFVLNCPVKANPPNWQHGRVLYSLLHKHFDSAGASSWTNAERPVAVLDIGTAKGFSAVVMSAALSALSVRIPVYTVDVIDPKARILRNTVAEVDGPKTLYEVMDQFLIPGSDVRAFGGGSMDLLSGLLSIGYRIPFAFVDGKHTYDAVLGESRLLSKCQMAGDIIVYDDCQIPAVFKAATDATAKFGYSAEIVQTDVRKYLVAKRLK